MNGEALGSHIVHFLIQTSQEETPGGHIYSVLEGDGIYVPTEVSNGWNVDSWKGSIKGIVVTVDGEWST